MVADVSNLVNMLATQPGQQVAGMGQQLLAAQEGVRKRKQQEFENTLATQKAELDKRIAEGTIKKQDLEIAIKSHQVKAPIIGAIKAAPKGLARQQLFAQFLPALKAIGASDEQLQQAMQNLDNDAFLDGVLIGGMAAQDSYNALNAKEKVVEYGMKSLPVTREGEARLEHWQTEDGKPTKLFAVGPIKEKGGISVSVGKPTLERVKNLESEYTDLSESARGSANISSMMGKQIDLLAQGAEVGKLEGLQQTFGEYAKIFAPELVNEFTNVTNTAELEKITHTLAQNLATNQKGNLNKEELNMIYNSIADISSDPDAAPRVLKLLKGAQDRKVEEFEFYAAYDSANRREGVQAGESLIGVRDAWLQFVKNTPTWANDSKGKTHFWNETKEKLLSINNPRTGQPYTIPEASKFWQKAIKRKFK